MSSRWQQGWAGGRGWCRTSCRWCQNTVSCTNLQLHNHWVITTLLSDRDKTRFENSILTAWVDLKYLQISTGVDTSLGAYANRPNNNFCFCLKALKGSFCFICVEVIREFASLFLDTGLILHLSNLWETPKLGLEYLVLGKANANPCITWIIIFNVSIFGNNLGATVITQTSPKACPPPPFLKLLN